MHSIALTAARYLATLTLLLASVIAPACSCGAPTAGPPPGGDGGSVGTGDDDAGRVGETDSGPTGETDSGPTGETDSGPTAETDSGPTGETDSGPTGETDSGPTAETDSGPPPNEPPSVGITAPAEGAEFARGETIAFDCDVTDPEDGTVPASSITWSSTPGGLVGNGPSILNALADAGSYIITCTAEDSEGLVASDSINIVITQNFVPDVAIIDPDDGSFHKVDEPINFLGSAVDPEDGLLSGTSLRWLLDGALLGTGASVQTTLPVGTYLAVFEATDSDGAVASASVQIEVVTNLPPVCTVASPASGEHVLEGDSFTADVACTDPDGTGDPTTITWSSDQDDLVGTGTSPTITLTSTGAHVLTVCAVDTTEPSVSGCTSVDVIVDVNQPPTVSITSPSADAVVPACTQIELRCAAADPEDRGLTVTWYDNAVSLGQGENRDVTPQVSGAHVFTCTATDSGGKQTSAQVAITVESPTATILSPDDGIVVPLGDPLTLEGSACDAESGVLTGAQLTWLSSLAASPQIGQGETTTVTLDAGLHQISLVATDPDGDQGFDSINVRVDAPPTVSITSPSDAAIFDVAEAITFSATASDPEDGPLLPDWRSHIQGALFTGETATRSDLLPGAHVVTASVVDAYGLSASDSVAIEVRPGGAGGPSLFQSLLAVGRVNELVPDGSGGYWVSTQNDGLYHLDGAGAQLDHFTADNSDLPSDQVLAVTVLGNGELAVATNAGLAWRCDPVDATCDNVFAEGDLALVADRITAVLELPDGRVVVGTDDCLMVSDFALPDHQSYCGGDGGGDGLADDPIHDLDYDPVTGGVWVSTPDGASLMTLEAAPSLAASFITYDSGDGLASDTVNAVAVAPSGEVWFATDGGLTRLVRGASNSVTSYEQNDGLPSSTIRDVAIDVIPVGGADREIAWGATPAGLGRVDPIADTAASITGFASDDLYSVDIGPAHVKLLGTGAGLETYAGW